MAQTLTPEIIDAAIEGFESQKNRIDQQIAELRAMRNGTPAAAPATKRRGRTMSAEGRARIAEAQRRRWAASRGESESVDPKPPMRKRRRRLSAEGRAAIVAALKKRWAAKRAGSVKTAPKKGSADKMAAKASARKATKRAAAKKAVKTAHAPAPTASSAQ